MQKSWLKKDKKRRRRKSQRQKWGKRVIRMKKNVSV